MSPSVPPFPLIGEGGRENRREWGVGVRGVMRIVKERRGRGEQREREEKGREKNRERG